eukprot:2841930-Pyramimonas_sp.AAC.1
MDGALLGVGVHALAEEAGEPHLLAHEAAGDGDRLSADGNLRETIRPAYCTERTSVTRLTNTLHQLVEGSSRRWSLSKASGKTLSKGSAHFHGIYLRRISVSGK